MKGNGLLPLMSPKKDGQFSASIYSLQLQLKSLLEEAGGDHAIELLDTLCNFSRTEQQVILGVMLRAANRILASGVRFSSREEQALKEFEDSLVGELTDAMGNAAQAHPRPCHEDGSRVAIPLSVLQGGKDEVVNKKSDQGDSQDPSDGRSGLIDFTSALRSKRKSHTEKPVLN